MTFVQPLAVFADVMTPSNVFTVNPDYLLSSSSNALLSTPMTLELGEDDFIASSPRSSIARVDNTIDYDDALFYVQYTNVSTGAELEHLGKLDSNGHFSWTIPLGYKGVRFGIRLYSGALPNPGNYTVKFDFSSDFTLNYLNNLRIFARKNYTNATPDMVSFSVPATYLHGDIYSEFTFDYGGLGKAGFMTMYVYDDPVIPAGSTIGGYFSLSFTSYDGTPQYSGAGAGDSVGDVYEEGVSDSLSDISSSIGDMSSSLDSAAENLEYISTSQNLIIQGIDNVIMHISDQLYAFWDQLYNLIHEPTFARLGDILDAIRNLDLEITVEMTEVTNAVNKMNQEVQNKLQQTTDKITGGFDNSVMESEANKLDTSISEYDEAEQSVIQNVNDSLDNFEFDAELSEYQSIVSVISEFLQELYDSSGGFKVLINLSMLLSLAGIVIGIYRFGGGS